MWHAVAVAYDLDGLLNSLYAHLRLGRRNAGQSDSGQ
jgi:hypothetical protein